MPRIEVLTEVSGRDSEALLTEHVPTEMLADQHYAEQREQAIQTHKGGSAPAAAVRSVRRATARRASDRRATARNREGDTNASIIDFLARHAGSTAGDLAKGLNLNPGSVSARLTQLAKAGEIKKASHGYSTKQVARPRRQQRPLHRSP
jgi:uncharacterized membrane protein